MDWWNDPVETAALTVSLQFKMGTTPSAGRQAILQRVSTALATVFMIELSFDVNGNLTAIPITIMGSAQSSTISTFPLSIGSTIISFTEFI